MKRNLSAFGLLWISFTSMVGSGWLFGSLYSCHFAGPAALIAWPLAGFLLFLVALSYAEVATMFPEKGNLARLPLYTHGRLTSVILSTLTWLSLATLPVIETQGIIQYASNYLPNLVSRDGVQYTITWLGYFLSLIVLMSFVLINYFGVRIFAYVNTSFTIWKLLIPALTAILLLLVSYDGKNFSQYGGFMPYGWQGVMSAMSSGGVLFSLLGFRQVVILASEIEKPEKYIPFVLFSSLALTAVLYTALQWAFISSLRPEDLTHGWAKLSFPGDAGPFAALAIMAGMMWLSVLLYLDAFISPYSTGLAYTTTASHMLAGMSEIKNAPKKFAELNKYHVPYVGLLVNFFIAAIMFFLLRDWQAMASFIVAVLMISYAVGPLALVCLRKQIPHYRRPFRLRYGYIISIIGFYICTAGVYWSGWNSVLRLLVLTILGLCIYLFYSFFIKKLTHEYDVKHSIWIFCYLLGLAVFSYLGNFGGKNMIPPFWDLFLLMIFSFVIFAFAIYSCKPWKEELLIP